jgi:hypothetical protein
MLGVENEEFFARVLWNIFEGLVGLVWNLKWDEQVQE